MSVIKVNPSTTPGPGDPNQAPLSRRARLPLISLAGLSVLAVVLAAGPGGIWLGAIGLVLLLAGLYLIHRDTHWALCFIAFAIGPLNVVQQELAGVTLNLPEVLILALAAKEALNWARGGFRLPAAFPRWSVSVFVIAATVGLATGFLNHNGAVRVLQDGRQFTEFLVLFWLVLRCVRGRDEALRITAAYVAGLTLLAIHGIVQQVVPVGISATQISSDLVLHHGIRSGSFYGATTLGGLMVLAVAPAAGVALSTKRRAIQVLMAVCALLCAVAIVYTRTRGSWIGLGVALALLGVSVRPSGKTLAAMAGAGVVLALVLGPLVVQRLYTLADPEQDISLMARAQYYAAASHIGQAHPFLGLGWGCYYDIDAILKAEQYVRVPIEEATVDEAGAAIEATVHSAYLQLFVKTGILGLGAFLAIIVVWLERIWRGRNTRLHDAPARALYVGITAGIAGYLFHSTFENFFQWPVMAQSFWLLLGLSFVLAPAPETGGQRYAVPLAFTGAVVAAFLVFMYACLRLETFHTDHYERNVAKALAQGDLKKALHIAHRATEVDLYEPMPFTVYARLLFLNGETEAALEALETALGTTQRSPAPRSRFTGPRYYFAPARLILGRYYAESGDWQHALQQFELARGYADLQDSVYAEFHPVLYAAYLTRGWWARALEFGTPSTDDLKVFQGASLLRLARVCEGREDWTMLAQVASQVLTRDPQSREALYYLGRCQWAADDTAAAVESLRKAGTAVDRAPYFLGKALAEAGRIDEAVAACQALPEGQPYRIPALAEAWSLAKSNTSLLEAIRTEFQRLHRVLSSSTEGPRLLAVQWPDPSTAYGGPFPVLTLWGSDFERYPELSGASVTNDNGEIVVRFDGTDLVLQLRWVQNLLNWDGVDRAYPTDDVFPGWVDSTRDWYDLRNGPGAHIPDGLTEDPALILNGPAWFYSVPALNPAVSGYLLAGSARDPEGSARLSWQYLDEETPVHQGVLLDRAVNADWTRFSAVLPSNEGNAVRVGLETTRPGARPAYDGMVLVPLSPPRSESVE
jgi:O-antigen ligase/tetratricopeptide (TPR) repeat protein